MAYKVIILYQLYMPSYFLGTFTEYPSLVKPINDGISTNSTSAIVAFSLSSVPVILR